MTKPQDSRDCKGLNIYAGLECLNEADHVSLRNFMILSSMYYCISIFFFANKKSCDY